MRQKGRLDNFGIRRVERLDGNVGYLDLHRVPVPANAGPAIAAAMELVAGTYALIIDLRHNHGGSPEGVVFWCSYLLTERPTHLNDIFHADTGETRQFWALPYVPGTRYPDRPVYLLTSSHTFSGGEDFCYTLQALGRAQVIGETTGGGAHPTRPFPISAAVHIAIPFARSVNPVTGTNWQGTGVVPDVAVPEAQAYDVAYAQALTQVLALDDVPTPIAYEAREALAAAARRRPRLTRLGPAAGPADPPGRRVRRVRRRSGSGQDLGLLPVELLGRDDAPVAQVGQLGQLIRRTLRTRGLLDVSCGTAHPVAVPPSPPVRAWSRRGRSGTPGRRSAG